MSGAFIYNDYEHFCRQAGEHILSILNSALVRKPRFSLVLAGGSSPKGIYTYLAKHKERINWGKADLFIGDERCVPEDHVHSNYRMILENFLSPLNCEETRVFRSNTALPPQEGAKQYHEEIKNYHNREGAFDLVLLGMGADGHTASLFPGYPETEEKKRLVRATDKEGPLPPYHRRITMTPPALNKSRHIFFLLKGGQEKKEIMDRILLAEKEKDAFPIEKIHPLSGKAYWYYCR